MKLGKWEVSVKEQAKWSNYDVEGASEVTEPVLSHDKELVKVEDNSLEIVNVNDEQNSSVLWNLLVGFNNFRGNLKHGFPRLLYMITMLVIVITGSVLAYILGNIFWVLGFVIISFGVLYVIESENDALDRWIERHRSD